MSDFELDTEDIIENVLDKVEELLVDTLASYQELILNCHSCEEEGSSLHPVRDGVMYDEINSGIPVFTITERLIEDFKEELLVFLENYLSQD